MTSRIAGRPRALQRLSLSRPRWENLLVAASLLAFWAGVILKIFG
jgi:hypothetical protein